MDAAVNFGVNVNASTTPRTFPVTIDADGIGNPRARMLDLRDVCPVRGFGIPGDSRVIAETLAKLGGLSAAQIRGVEHALEYAIRHAGYYVSAPEECAVDFDKVDVVSIGGRTVLLTFSGLAHVQSREKPGRFLVAYSHCLAIGRRGSFKATERGNRRVSGQEAVSGLDYFGKGAE
jgi:hypothetical protein